MSRHSVKLAGGRQTLQDVLRLLILSLVTTVAAITAHAGDKQAAKQHFDEGNRHYENEAYGLAVEEFRASLADYPTVSSFFNLANCLVAQEMYGDALKTVEEMAQTFGSDLSTVMKREVETLEKTIRNTASRLEVTVNPEDATVYIDDKALAGSTSQLLWLRPGTYLLRVEKEGFEPETEKVTLTEGERVEIHRVLRTALPEAAPLTVGPEPAPTTAPTPVEVDTAPSDSVQGPTKTGLTVQSRIALGGTIALAAACGVFYGLAGKYAADHETYKNNYEDAATDEEAAPWKTKETDAYDSNRLFQNLGLGFAVGAGAAAVTTTILILTGRAKSKGSNAPDDVDVSLGAGNLTVRF